MRLIDADVLKSEKFYSHERHENCVSVYAIDMMPTIERPHGEWIVDKKIYCSECGESICDFVPNPTDAVGLILSNNFCYNCGADNRKGGESE